MQTKSKPKVCEGLTPVQARQLIKYTNSDPLILANTHDLERFKDKKTFARWIGKHRKIYSLVDKKQLIGIIWFGNKPMPKEIRYITSVQTQHYTITFAIRIYANARGKGLSKNFINKAWQMYSQTPEYLDNPNKGIWLQTNINNFPAVSSYKKVGFKLVSKPDKQGKVIMCQS